MASVLLHVSPRRRGAASAALLALLVTASLALPAGPAVAGVPLCFGKVPTLVGTPGDDIFDGVDDNSLYGTNGPDVIHGLGGVDAIYGQGGKDLICGGDGADITLNGGPGNDKIDGGASERDALSFIDFGDPAGVDANLATGQASGEASGEDTFKNAESIQGTFYNDRLTGDGGSNLLVGVDGNDRIAGGDGEDLVTGDAGLLAVGDDTMKGGPGFDYVSFSSAPDEVNVDLEAGSATGEGADEFADFEGAIGSLHNDTLSGTNGTNFFVGDPIGNDGTADDTIDGRGGTDFMLYLFAPGPVNATMDAATGEGSDSYSGMEAIIGSPYDDTLQGNGARNALFGGGGGDMLFGLGADDYLDGESGSDGGSGGGGKDQCIHMEGATSCESSSSKSSFKTKKNVGTRGFRKR